MVEKFKEMFEILAWPFPRGGNEGDRKISLYKPLYQVAIVSVIFLMIYFIYYKVLCLNNFWLTFKGMLSCLKGFYLWQKKSAMVTSYQTYDIHLYSRQMT